LNERDFPAWQKVKGFLTKSKSTPGAVKAAQKTCGSDDLYRRSISELPTLNRLRLFKEQAAKLVHEIEEDAMAAIRSFDECKSWFATIMSNRHFEF